MAQDEDKVAGSGAPSTGSQKAAGEEPQPQVEGAPANPHAQTPAPKASAQDVAEGEAARPAKAVEKPHGKTAAKARHKPKAPKPRIAGAAAPARRATASGADQPVDPDKKQAARGAQFIGLVFGAYVAFLFFSGQIEQFSAAFQNLEMSWVVGALVCIGMYFVLGTLAYVTAVYLDHDSPVGIRDLMAVEASGNFFGNLTPMQMGALPSQIYQLTKAGLSLGAASATQFTRFIMFQLGVVLFAAVMLWAKLGFFVETYGDIVFLNLLVFAGHALELLGLFVVCLCPNFVRRAGGGLLRWASRRGWVKNHAKWDEMLNVQVGQFSRAFRRSAANIPDMVVTLVITLLQLSFLYMVPWFVLHAFGVEADFLTCLAAGSMVQLVSSAVPLPGGTGGAEGGFALFFGGMFGPYATAGFLVWRVVTFFVPTFMAVPLLGLKSARRESIYHRVHRLSPKGGRRGGVARGAVALKGGVAAVARRAGTAKGAAGKDAAASKAAPAKTMPAKVGVATGAAQSAPGKAKAPQPTRAKTAATQASQPASANAKGTKKGP